MGLGIKEMLRSVCCNNGWCYAIFWWSDRRNSMFLTPEDAYYEKQIGMEVDKMLQQVHMVGEGIIGQAAFTGKHRWILSDAYCGEWSSRGTVNNQVVFQDNAELQSQFSAGIKTIAIVNVATHGVVQLGSTQKILEKLEYVEQIRSLFQQMDSLPGSFLSGNAQKSLNGEIYDLRGAFATVVSSGNSYSTHAAINSFHDDSSKEMMAKVQSSTTLTHTLSPFSSGLNCGSMQPNVLAVPVISHSIPASNRYQLPSTEAQLASDFQRTSLFTRNSSFHLTNRYQLASAEAQVILSTPNIQLPQVLLQPNSNTSNYSTASNPSMSTWSSGVSCLTSMGQQLLSGIGLQGTPHMYPTNSHEVVPSRNLFNNSQRDSILTSLYSPSGSLDTMTNTGYGSGKLTDIRHSAPIFNEIEDELSTGKLYSRGAPFVPELSKESDIFHTFRGKFLTDNAALAISKSNPVNNQAHSTAQPLQQVNNTFAAPMDESLLQALGIVSPSSGLVGGDLCSGVSASGMPSSGQHTIADTVSSIAAACDRKENSSIASMQLPTDNDLFDSLGLDSKHSQGWVCWDNIEFPVGSGNLSNLSTGGSECISELIVDPMTGPEKGLFSKFDLEKLLEAAEGNVNPATNHNAEVHLPATTITRAGGMSAYNDHVPLAGLSCLSGSLDALLPESSSEKTLKEVLPKAQVSSWIGDTYSINAESSVTPQPERPEEHVKVTRKRARPGESTRPRPKDRQQIQDRVKELREIVPNGAKCSIDSLLDRTIKHMLFLQSVTKYADKLKQADEPKMIDKENCVVLKDNSSGSGATWAFEVGGQTMICPIIVEDLNPPGQMLVEMLCEERGFFLEIADIIRGFGLTILKGVMEVRDEKIWARFVVEANGGVTRMDIFLSLVQLLQQTSTCSIGSTSPPTKVSDSGAPSIFTNYQQSPMQVPISLSDRFQ